MPDAASVFAQADMVVKVKEPQPQESAMLRPGQILYTYLHLAPDPAQTAALVQSGAICIAYETITGVNGGLPLLAPMSEVAGRMAVQAGAAHLEKSKGGMGVLLGGVPGCLQRMWSFWGRAWSAPMLCKWPLAWARALP